MVTEKKGDLLKAEEDIIAHQVNCKGVMGAGIAKLIRMNLLVPELYSSYQSMCRKYGSQLLGKCYLTRTDEEKAGKWVANLFGEDIPTGTGMDTDYDALGESLKSLELTAWQYGLSVALPGYLGCGLAGGNWEIVYRMVCSIFRDSTVNVTIYYIDESIRELWKNFGDVPMNPETECIERDWHGFSAGTHREEIWRWFEDTFHVSVAEDLLSVV